MQYDQFQRGDYVVLRKMCIPYLLDKMICRQLLVQLSFGIINFEGLSLNFIVKKKLFIYVNRGLKYPTIIFPEPMCFIMVFKFYDIWGLKFRCINIYNSYIVFINFSLYLFYFIFAKNFCLLQFPPCVYFQWSSLSLLISFHSTLLDMQMAMTVV